MTDKFSTYFDVNKMIREATERIADQTESALRDAIVAELRGQGWTLVPPQAANIPPNKEREALARVEEFALNEGVVFSGGPAGSWLPGDKLLDILGDGRPRSNEPHGEVPDTVVRAALKAWVDSLGPDDETAMRAALRAASAVTEPGENHG